MQFIVMCERGVLGAAVLVITILMIGTATFVRAQEPIPAGSDVPLANAQNEVGSQLLKRMLLDAFEKNTPKSAPGYADMHRIITWYVTRHERPEIGREQYRERAAEAREILKLGVKSPEFRYVCGSMDYYGLLYPMTARFEELCAMNEEEVSPYIRLQALRGLMGYASLKAAWPQYVRDFEDALEAFCKQERPDAALERYVIGRWVMPVVGDGDLPIDALEALTKRVDAISRAGLLTDWASGAVGGQYHIEAAWRARGSGLAHTVTAEGWEGFREHLDRAEQLLMQAYERFPGRPDVPALMITIAMARGEAGGKTGREWFDLAVRSEFDFEQPYLKMLWSLRPRWGGSHRSMYEFGLEAARTDRYDTKIPWMLVRAIDDISTDRQDYEYLKQPGVWNEVRTVLETYLAQDTPTFYPPFIHARLALFAWAAGEYEFARQQYELGKDEIDDSHFRYRGLTRERFERDLAALSQPSKAAAFILSAEGFIRIGAYDKAVEMMRDALKDVPENDPGRPRFMNLLASAELLRDASTENGASLTFEAMNGWQSDAPDRWIGQGKALTFNGAREGGWIMHRAPLGQRFELTGRITVSEDDFLSEPGISIRILSTAENDDRSPKGTGFGFSPHQADGVVAPKGNVISQKRTQPPFGGFDFRIRVFDDMFAVEVDGKEAYRGTFIEPKEREFDAEARANLQPESESAKRFGFQIAFSRNPARVIFSDLRVHLLETRPEDW